MIERKNLNLSWPIPACVSDRTGANGLYRPQPARLRGIQRRRPRHHQTSSGEVDVCLTEIAKMRELTDKPFGVNLPLLFIREPRVVDLVARAA